MWVYAFIFCCCLLRSQCAGNADSFKEEKPLDVFNLAKDYINRAKDLITNSSDHEPSTDGTDCGKKEKAVVFLEIASNLINEAERKYSNCIDSEPTGTPRYTRTTPRHTGRTWRPTGTTPRHTGRTWRPTGTTPRHTGTTWRPTGTTPRHTGTTWRPTGTTPRHTGTSWRPTGTTPRHTGTTYRPTGTTPRHTGTTWRPTGTTTRHTGTTPRPTETPRFGGARDCTDLFHDGYNKSGVYRIWRSRNSSYDGSIEVFCDMETDGGGWTVIQRRGDFSEEAKFYQAWEQYKRGFGDLREEFWLGNDAISALTNQGNYAARFNLEDVDGNTRFASYSSFRIENETALYRLHISGYSGNAGNSMEYENDSVFCTWDRYNGMMYGKVPCAISRKSGWWMKSCNRANLNGWRHQALKNDPSNMYWEDWKGYESLAAAEIKLRRTD